MKTLHEKRKEILSIRDPHKACIRLSTDVNCSLDIAEQVMQETMEKYGVTAEEMMCYPNEEPVVTQVLFEEKAKEK